MQRLALALLCALLALPAAARTPRGAAGVVGSGCNLLSPAFCDNFDEGPTSSPGREGDLNPANWSVGHLAPVDMSGGGGVVADPTLSAPIPTCKASAPTTPVYPPSDTQICDPSGARGSQLMTAVASQNYGTNSYMIRQPFDFAGRTGKIEFDTDGGNLGYQQLGGYPEIMITDAPVPATTFQEFQNFEAGPTPANAIDIKFAEGGSCSPTQISPANVMVYNNYSPTILSSSGNVGCSNISSGDMNHFEIQLSQTNVAVYGTDYSTDGGNTFTNFHLLYSNAITLPFTRGYVHISARNHASEKYFSQQDVVYHWDNIGFDGPAITNTARYEVADNTTITLNYPGSAPPETTGDVMNLGYQLQDGTVKTPAGIWSPTTYISNLTFSGVNISSATSALLTFSAFLDNIQGTSATTSWGWQFQFNGGTQRTRTLTSSEVVAIGSTLTPGGGGSVGNIAITATVPVGDLVNGTNTFNIVPVGVPMGYPPVIANIDLLLTK
jgi:hypothetical protein